MRADLEANGIERGPESYSAHTLWSYEVGSKAHLLNNAVSGAQIQGVPTYNGAVSAQYNFAAFGDKSDFVMGGMEWVGPSHGALDPRQTDYERPPYHTAHVSAGLAFERYQLSLFVKNAFDDDTIIQHPQVASIVQGYRVASRSIGMSLAAKF